MSSNYSGNSVLGRFLALIVTYFLAQVWSASSASSLAIPNGSRWQNRHHPPSPSSGSPHTNGQQSNTVIHDLFRLTNAERERFQLESLQFNPELSIAADHHALDMANKGYFSHTGCVDGSSVADRVVSLTQYRYTSVAENLYCRYPDNDAIEAVQGWMNSPGHRKNLLSEKYSDIGLGYASVGNDHYYVQVFGSPIRSPKIREENTHEYLLHRTNEIRQRQSLPLLLPSNELGAVAQIHAEDLLKSTRLSEQRRDGTSIFSWRRSANYQQGGTAASFFRQEPFHDPERVLQSWLKSRPCYILDRRYTEVGFGYATDNVQHYYVQLFFGSNRIPGFLSRGNAPPMVGRGPNWRI